MKKIACALVCVMMFIPLCHFTDSLAKPYEEQLDNNYDDSMIGRMFVTCYIEASGKVGGEDRGFFQFSMWKSLWFRPFLNDLAVVTYWHIPFDSDAEVTIYSREGGRVLWDHEGQQRINIIGYFGTYIPKSTEDDSLHVTISGTALVAMPKQF